LIEAGYAAVKIMPPHDDQLVMIDVLGPGDLVNADDTWSEESTVLHIEALRTVRCYLLKRKLLYALLRAQPQLSEELLVWQSRTLKAWYQWLALFVYSDSETRLTQVLYRLAQRYGFPEGQGRRLYLPLRRRDFAELAGVTAETATRVMSQLRRRGLIRMESDSIFIPAPALLAPKPAR
jgi:CRP/FNR family transcriptional regulator